MLQIDLMTIKRVVVHTIPSRSTDKGYVAPTGGNALVHLPGGHPNCPTYGHPNCSTWPG